MRCKFILIWGILFLPWTFPGIIFSGAIRSLTLQESIEIALRNNLSALSAKEEIRGAEFRKKASFDDFLPKLSAQYAYSKLNEAPTLPIPRVGNIPLGWEETYQFSLNLEQPLFTGFYLKTLHDLAGLGLDTSKIRLERISREITLKVKEAYFYTLKAEKLKEVAEQAFKKVAAHREVARHFYEAGMIPKNDLLQAEVQLAQFQQNLVKAENGVELARASFNTLLRLGLEEIILMPEPLNYQPFTFPLEIAQQKALANRPEVQELNLLVAQAGKSVDLVRSNYYPKVVLSASYTKSEDKPIPQTESWNVIALAKWTFWEWGKTNHQVEEGKVKIRQAENAREELMDGIRLEVKQAYLGMMEAGKNIPVAQKAIEQAEENLRINQARYQEQAATSTDVLDAQTLLTRALTNYTNALADYNIAQARLEKATGAK
ncbi:MAG: TolC family protein [Deltaproteobacteria bacterium]|nr:TolC family protein [Deltaproteobacteria bacterium]